MDIIEQRTENRGIYFTDKAGKRQLQLFEYKLVFKNKKLLNVINKYNNTVEKNSDCFDFFAKKYSV